MKKIKFDLRFLYLFIPLLLLEICFRIVQIPSFNILTLLRSILFTLFLAVLISFILTRFKNNKVFKIAGFVIIFVLCAYTFAELIFKNFMGDYYSFGTVSDGATRVAQFAGTFFKNAKLKYYLCLFPIVAYVLLIVFVKFNSKGNDKLSLIVCIGSFLLLCGAMFVDGSSPSLLHIYATFNNKDIIIDKIGIEHFLFRDLSALVFKAPETIVLVKEEDDIVDEPVILEKTRVIDDTLWNNISSNETNSNMKTIDEFLKSKKISQPNDHTGIYEGYNFIYVLVESGDYFMIDKDLTPTLYKMYSNGLDFNNHYTPLYSCATGESEFVSYTSIFPYINSCTPNYVLNDYFYEALPWLFKNEGYTTIGFHNWRDEWYERNDILKHVGIDTYYDIDDIMNEDKSVKLVKGWQSDLMLVEHAWDHIKEIEGNYFAMIISSTMHFPYDENSYYGDAYVDQVSAVHPDWNKDFKRYMSKCIEFDKSMEYLLKQLEDSGQLDNTVICMYCDHRPYWLNYDELIDITSPLNKRNEFSGFGDSGDEQIGVYRSPFIVYNSLAGHEVNNNYCSTIDHAPTIANLFNLKYDPRLFIGKDAFDSSNTIIFTNGDWVNDKGIYDASKNLFTPRNSNENVPESYVSNTNSQVQNQINISTLILDNKYFEKRKDICYPNYE